MAVDQIARANRAAASLVGGVSVREFARCEFPREDVAWVATWARPSHPAKAGRRRSAWKRLKAAFGSPEETEADSEAISEPAPA